MGFLLHCGAREVPRRDLALVPVPEAQKRFCPVPHDTLADAVQFQLETAGFDIVQQRHALNKDGAQYFGYYEVRARQFGAFTGLAPDYGVIVGFRSSYDMSLAIKIALGSRVFICDNLALNGDITVFRKHTSRVLADLEPKIAAGVAKLPGLVEAQDVEYTTWKDTPIDSRATDHLIGELYRNKVVPRSSVAKLFDEFEVQSEDHGARTLWRMFNATTQVLKSPSDNNLVQLPHRTQRLHRVLNEFVAERPLPVTIDALPLAA